MDKTAEDTRQGLGSLLIGKFGVILGLVVLCVIFTVLS
mgnify:FL=1